MWEFATELSWNSGKKGRLKAGNIPEIEVATPPEFGGPPDIWSPEDLLAGAVNSCIMTTSLYFLERSGIELLSYDSRATARVEKSKEGLVVTGVTVEVEISVADEANIEKAYATVEKAEKSCLISKSLRCEVSLKVSATGPPS